MSSGSSGSGVNLGWRHDLAWIDGFDGCESGNSGGFGLIVPVWVTGFRIGRLFCHHWGDFGNVPSARHRYRGLV